MTQYGYIYYVKKDKDKVIQKLKELTPPYVRNAIELLMNQKKVFTLNSLVELTHGNFESMEYYLDKVFKKQLNWIENSYYKSFKIYWNSRYSKDELLEDFKKSLSKIHKKTREEGIKFEREIRRMLDEYLMNLPFKVVKDPKVTVDGKYFFDAAYSLYMFGDTNLTVKLRVEIKSYIPSLNQVAFFWRKIRMFRHGVVIPVIIAPAFPSVVYKSFGDILYLVKYDKLKEFVESLVVNSLCF